MTWYVGRRNGAIVSASEQEGNPGCPEAVDATDAGLAVFLQPLTDFLNRKPNAVSRMQAMVALSNAGLLGQVQAWVAAQDATTQLIWASATTFSRDSALLGSAATALSLTPSALDALFGAASKINP
jgi:hypothetical protein